MNPRTTLILAAIAGALGAFVFFYEIGGEPERVAAEREAKAVFPGLQASEIDEIGLRSEDGVRVVARRGAGRWQLVEPVAGRADDLVFDGLADTLADLESERTLVDPAPLADYQLSEDQAALRLRAGEREYGLRLGGRAPVGGGTYATVVAPTASGEVLLLLAGRAQAFRRPLADLREKRILDFEAEEVLGISVHWPEGAVELARDRGEEPFRVTEPSPHASDEAVVGELLRTLAFLRAEGFIDGPGPELIDSFGAPAFEATLRLSSGQVQRFALSGLEREGRRVVRVGDADDTLYEVRPELLEELPTRIVDYRFKELVRFDPDAADEVEIVFEDPSAGASEVVRVVKEEGGWQGSPDTWGPGQADAFVRVLSELDASDIAAEAMGEAELEALGLAPPWVRIRAKVADDALAELHLGRSDSEKGVLAKVPDRDTVYRIDYLMAARMPISFEAYRNRFVSGERDEGAGAVAAPE